MPTFLIVILCIVGFVAAIFGLGLQFLATGAANGGTYSLMKYGEWMFGVGAAAFIAFGLWALARWIGWYGVGGIVFAIYAAGGIVACHRVTHSTKEYSRSDLICGVLYSWFGVLLMDAG